MKISEATVADVGETLRELHSLMNCLKSNSLLIETKGALNPYFSERLNSSRTLEFRFKDSIDWSYSIQRLSELIYEV